MILKKIALLSLVALIFISHTIELFSQSNNFEGPVDLGIVDDSIINEASGIAASRKNKNILWVHNDDSPEARVFAINTSAKIVAIYVLNIKNGRDWEDIAIGPGPEDNFDYIYFGDIGDNLKQFKTKDIYRFKEPYVSEDQKQKIDTIREYDKITFKFPDKIYDSEALMIDPQTKDLYVITKRLDNEKVYKIEYPQSVATTITADFVTELPFGYEGMNGSGVTAADISSEGTEILIKTYSKVYYFRRNSGETIKEALKKDSKSIHYQMEPQGEGISWHPASLGYYTISERSPFLIPAHLYYYKRVETSVKKKKNSKKMKKWRK